MCHRYAGEARDIKPALECKKASLESGKIRIDELAVRIGVHTGTVVAGNMGSQHTMKYGVVGDAVNVAARLEQLNNETHTRILISEVYSRLTPSCRTWRRRRVTLP